MTRCARGPLVFWLLMMFTGESFYTTCCVCAEDHDQKTAGRSSDPRIGEVWRDWLPVEDGQPSPLDDSMLVRRITPKSVFVAPNFSGCSDGYRQDVMGRCVKLVKVNQAAQLDFILQKLNSKYAPSSNANTHNSNNDNKNDSGPFHVSLPIDAGIYNNVRYNSSSSGSRGSISNSSYSNNTSSNNISSSGSNNNNNNNSSSSNNNIIDVNNMQINSTTVNHMLYNDIILSSVPATVATLDHNTTTSSTDDFMLWVTNPGVLTSDQTKTSSGNNFLGGTETRSTTVAPTLSIVNTEDHFINEDVELETTTNTKRPFVIVVANSNYNLHKTYSPSIVPTTQSLSSKEPSTDIYTSTVGVHQYNFESTTSETLDSERENTFSESLPSTFSTLSVMNEHRPVTTDTNTETSFTSPFDVTTSSDTDRFNSFTFTSTHVPTTAMAELNISPEDEPFDEEDKIKFPSTVSEEPQSENNDKEHLFESSDTDSKIITRKKPYETELLPISSSEKNVFTLQDGTTINCENISDLQLAQINGKIINTNSIYKNCHPLTDTTSSYPVRTTTPKQPLSYYIRFPPDSVTSKPLPSYLSSLPADDHKKNNLIRFPNRPSVSSPYRPLPYGTKVWNLDDGMASSATSSGVWYSPSSWLPFLQSHNNWMNYPNHNTNYNDNNDMNRPLSVSNMYHKQYVNYRPSGSLHSTNWVNRHVSWPPRE